MMRFEILDHTADTGIIAYGATLPELFEHAAGGMFSLMFDAEQSQEALVRCPIAAAGGTDAELLVGWLGELLSIAEIEDLAFDSFHVDHLEQGQIRGVAGGVSASERELIGPPIKAVTYHDLEVVETDEGWTARIIFDV